MITKNINRTNNFYLSAYMDWEYSVIKSVYLKPIYTNNIITIFLNFIARIGSGLRLISN